MMKSVDIERTLMASIATQSTGEEDHSTGNDDMMPLLWYIE